MVNIVKDYNNYISNIPHLIGESPYKSEYFVNLLDLKPATYYRKLKLNAFTNHEIKLITNALYPKEAYLEEIKADITEGRRNIENGEVVSHEVVMERIKQKYFSHQ